jgi:hypothetical protein
LQFLQALQGFAPTQVAAFILTTGMNGLTGRVPGKVLISKTIANKVLFMR